MKTPWKRDIWIAVVGGTVASGGLFALSFAIHPDHHPALSNLLFMAQYPGWMACVVLLPGSFESVSTTNYIGIALPANAILYAIAILGALRLIRRKHSHQGGRWP